MNRLLVSSSLIFLLIVMSMLAACVRPTVPEAVPTATRAPLSVLSVAPTAGTTPVMQVQSDNFNLENEVVIACDGGSDCAFNQHIGPSAANIEGGVNTFNISLPQGCEKEPLGQLRDPGTVLGTEGSIEYGAKIGRYYLGLDLNGAVTLQKDPPAQDTNIEVSDNTAQLYSCANLEAFSQLWHTIAASN